MKRTFRQCALGLLGSLVIAGAAEAADETYADSPEVIAFGSCYRTGKNIEIWNTIAEQQPDLFLFLGDNIYADTTDMKEMRAKYQLLLDEKPYAGFTKNCRVLSTWDDHDYGKDDAGVEFPAKEGSKLEFMRAFDIASDHPMSKHGGVYRSAMFGKEGQRMQIILLDTRWFRSPMKSEGEGHRMAYIPDLDLNKTVLGAEQWKWFEEQLAEPAELRIICSSIQVLSDYHRFEKWANFPLERRRFIDLVEKASGEKLILSGDRHMGEMAKLGNLIEITSSGMTNAGGGSKTAVNPYRIGERVGKRNFGTLKLTWEESRPILQIHLVGEDGDVLSRAVMDRDSTHEIR